MRAVRANWNLGQAERGAPLAMLSPPVLEAPARRRRGPAQGSGPPPDRWDGDGGHGGGGDGESEGGRKGPEDRGTNTAELAFGLLLVSICTLFAAFLLAWAVMRQRADWPLDTLRWHPHTLWVSTGLLLASELFMTRTAIRSSRRLIRRRLSLAALLGLGFLAAQAWIWLGLARAGALPSSDAYGAIFYALTGLHALHVVGGLVFMGILLRRLSGVGPPAGLGGLVLCRIYWRLMGALWLVVFTVLYFGD